MNLVYIDDVVEELIKALEGKENIVENFCEVPIVYTYYSRKNSGSAVFLQEKP